MKTGTGCFSNAAVRTKIYSGDSTGSPVIQQVDVLLQKETDASTAGKTDNPILNYYF